MKWTIAVPVAALVLAGCGGTTPSGKPSSTQTTTASSSAALSAACGRAQSQALTLGADASGLAQSNPPTSVTDRAITDADALKTSLTEIKSEVSGAGKQAQLDQYLSVVSQYTQVARAMASGDYQTAAGQLAGVAPEYAQLLPGLRALCPA